MSSNGHITWTTQKRKLGDLIEWPKNPRTLTEKQARYIEASLRKFGLADPPIINTDNVIVGGHQRKRIMSLMEEFGAEAEIDVRVPSRPLSERELEELNIRLNQNTGSFDFEALTATFEVNDLLAWGFEPVELGLPKVTFNGADAPAQIDRAAELQAKWQTATGQMWACGEHRIICGDCTDASVVARVMAGEKATLAPVDPPYNVGFDYDGKTVDDNKQADVYERFSRAWFGVCQSVSDRQIVTPGCYNLAMWLRWFDVFYVAAWTKTNAMTHGYVSRFFCWEPIIFVGGTWFQGNEKLWKRQRANDVFDYPVSNQTGVANHPCPKPLKMWADLLDNYSEAGDVIYEAFNGSGTTLIACEQLGRKCRAVEISAPYTAVALQRWADATGKQPVLIPGNPV